MGSTATLTPIAHIESPYQGKFGVPRQAGLAGGEARVVFEPAFRATEAVRGLEEFEYVWLIWQFHLVEERFRPTVRPPRLGGNRRVGVFATRSPFRPNRLGLSAVRLLRIEQEAGRGLVLYVEGADLADGTPIFDIKPYVPYADSHPDARAGFAQERPVRLAVVDDHGLLLRLPESLCAVARDVLAADPRPHYHHDPRRVYSVAVGGWTVRFSVAEATAQVVDVVAD